MFQPRYFPGSYFPDAYFPVSLGDTPPNIGAPDYLECDLPLSRAFFVIGDDLAFTVDNVTSRRTGNNLPDATVEYSLIDAETREEIASGEMVQYDADPSSFEAMIEADDLTEYDATTNPDGVVVKRLYVLRGTIQNNGVR